ncbi:MAG: hypothetical protein Q8L47_03020 [bacterium]|nr:hypothetical protein [bacterium]
MSRRKIFVKVSGDEFLKPAFLKWIKKICKKAWVVICVGGGTQINEEFNRRGFPVKVHGPMGREINTFEERQVQRDVLEVNQEALQDRLVKENIFAVVEIPIITIGTVLCPVNGDEMIRTAYLGFDELYIITTTITRAKEKAAIFLDLPYVTILYEVNGALKRLVTK